MSHETSPVRWTHELAEAPEALRAPFAAALGEGPTELQMRGLALKLAAISAGAAIASAATTSTASSSGVALGTASASTSVSVSTAASSLGAGVAKIVASLAVAGSAALGFVTYQSQSEPDAAPSQPKPIAVQLDRAAFERAVPRPVEPAPVVVPGIEASPETPGRKAAAKTHARAAQRSTSEPARPAITVQEPELVPEQELVAPPLPSAEPVRVPTSGEVELLRRARAALLARPREAFVLTERHRAQFPDGALAQERDALAVEALMRAGDMSRASELAERFVQKYPGSPHAHRFRGVVDVP